MVRQHRTSTATLARESASATGLLGDLLNARTAARVEARQHGHLVVDIARAAGVSHQYVSRATAGHGPYPYDDSGVALEAYVDVARPVFEAEMARFSDIYRKMDLAAVGPNTMYYIYTYRDYVDAGRVRAHLAAEDATFDGLARAIKLELQQAGVENPKINWVYLNSDGAHIATIEK